MCRSRISVFSPAPTSGSLRRLRLSPNLTPTSSSSQPWGRTMEIFFQRISDLGQHWYSKCRQLDLEHSCGPPSSTTPPPPLPRLVPMLTEDTDWWPRAARPGLGFGHISVIDASILWPTHVNVTHLDVVNPEGINKRPDAWDHIPPHPETCSVSRCAFCKALVEDGVHQALD